MDEFMDENFTKKESLNIKEEKDEIFEEFNGENMEIFDNNINNNEYDFELIDYIFNISFNEELNGVQGGYLVKIIRSLMHSLYSPNKSVNLMNIFYFGKMEKF